MDIGIATNSRGECSTRQGYSAVAKRAEQLGFAFIGVNDHLVVPRAVASRYPYSEDGTWAGAAAGGGAAGGVGTGCAGVVVAAGAVAGLTTSGAGASAADAASATLNRQI